MNNIEAIAATGAIEHITDGPVEDQFRQSCVWVRKNWLGYTFDEDGMFCSAAAAIIVRAERENRIDDAEIMRRSLDILEILNAASNGVPVDFAALCDRAEGKGAILPLAKIWQETKTPESGSEAGTR